MKRTAVLSLAMVLLLSACIPALPSLQQPAEAPAVDVGATDAALAKTLEAEALDLLPTPTLPASDTPEPTATLTNTSTPPATVTPTHVTVTVTTTETLTPDPNATTGTVTGTVEPGSPAVTGTGTLPTATLFTPTATETLYARFYGTLPPAIPFGKVKLINKSKAEVYISMHCTTVDGYTTIIEYPVPKKLNVSAPAGKYSYVAWVGGRQFQGSFSLGKGGDVEITFHKDKISIN